MDYGLWTHESMITIFVRRVEQESALLLASMWLSSDGGPQCLEWGVFSIGSFALSILLVS